MASRISAQTRQAHLDRLPDTPLDLLVIGGGITGAGIAWEAALRGLSVVVLEKGDFASGTSSKSSKLLHGGLRYLEQAEIKLVFESLAERNRLFLDAPHVAHKLDFLFPIFKGGADKEPVIGAGLWLYDALSALSNLKETDWHERVRPSQVAQEEPAIRQEGLRAAFRYRDGVTEDARLVAETLKSAVEVGAIALNYVEVTAFTKDAAGRVTGVEARDTLTDRPLTLKARRVFNAAGPWADALLKLDDPGARRRLRPTKGVHILTEAFVNDHAVVMRSASPKEKRPRVLFVIPWNGRTLIGTTDTDYKGPVDDFSYLDEDVQASTEEVRYLLDAVNATFKVNLSEKDVISAFAGWRPLVAPPEASVSESAVSREYEIFSTASGLLSIAGGKLTAYRSMARHAVERVIETLEPGDRQRLKPSAIEELALSGSAFGNLSPAAYTAQAVGSAPRWPAELVETIVNRYGSNWTSLAGLLVDDPRLAEPIPGLNSSQRHFMVEVAYAVEFEGAVTLADFLMRRTRLNLLDANQALDAAEPVAVLMGERLQKLLGWEDERRDAWTAQQLKAYRDAVSLSRRTRGAEPEERPSPAN